jgi:pilus assembly protein CpaE
MSRSSSSAAKTEVVVLTADRSFEAQARETFGASDQIVLRVVSGALSRLETELDMAGATVAVIDLDASQPAEMQALDRLMGRIGTAPPVVVITQAFDENVARTLLQMRAADFLIKPVSPVELVRGTQLSLSAAYER